MGLRGFIDSLTTSGLIIGWACGRNHHPAPLNVGIRDGNVEVAEGLAGEYRHDLAESGLGGGWCQFRLRATVPVRRLVDRRLTLVERATGLQIAEPRSVAVERDMMALIVSVGELVAADPTLLRAVEQLEGCAPMLSSFVDTYGEETFAQLAHQYLFGEAAEESDIRRYAGTLARGGLSPYELLVHLVQGRPLAAPVVPSSPNFPFRLAA